MSKNTHTKIFGKGEVIFREGEKGNCAYLIDHGRVEIRIGRGSESTPIAVLGIGDFFGEMAILDNATRSATAVALEPCELVEVSKNQINERVEDADPIVRFLISILINRLRDSLRVSEELTTSGVLSVTKVGHSVSKVVKLSDLKKNKEVVEKIKLEKALKDALDEDEFLMHYQPILDFKNGGVAGFEALMRWDSPERGMVRPDIFMGIAEETSLIVPLGQWLVKQVIRDFAKIKKQTKYKKPLFMSINIAAKQFNDKNLFRVLNRSCEQYGIHPKEIKLEITERVLLSGGFVFDWIKKARQMGYSVALDDFGTGFSSLSYLANLEVNNIKIDKTFVEKIIEDPKTRSIVRAIVDMSKSLDLVIIAEGVETQKEWNMLRDFGCTYMQGYLYSKPLALADLVALLTGQKKRRAA